jgi:uncharacterized membrane protein
MKSCMEAVMSGGSKRVTLSLLLLFSVCHSAIAGLVQGLPPRPIPGSLQQLLPTTRIPAPQDPLLPQAASDMSLLFEGALTVPQQQSNQPGNESSVPSGKETNTVLPPIVAPQDVPRQPVPARNSRYSLNAASSAVHQAPQLRVITSSAAPINIYQPANIKFTVINDGRIAAESVTLNVEIRGNGQVISTAPTAVSQGQTVFFSVGNIGAGESRECFLEFQASRAGQIEFVPRVTVSSSSAVSLPVSAPSIDIQIHGDSEFTVGQSFQQNVRIRNTGNETVRNLIISQANTPDGSLENTAFANQKQQIGSLNPGEQAEIVFSAVAVQPGEANLQISVNGENVRGSSNRRIKLTKSRISSKLSGPETSYVNSLGTYSISVSNDHDRVLDNVVVKLAVPQGMSVKVVDRPVAIDAPSVLTWNIPQLAAGGTEVIQFKAVSGRFGENKFRASINEGSAVVSQSELTTNIIGRADVGIELKTTHDPLEVGAETEVTIVVENRGTNAADQVNLEVHLPEGLQTGTVENAENTGRSLRFRPFELAAGQKKELKIRVKSVTAGDHVIRAEVASSASTRSISSEASLFFYESGTTRIADQTGTNDR